MKHYLSFILMLCVASVCAQDTITLVNQQILAVNIKAISSGEITYKYPSMPDGPDFILKREEVALIKFRNGVVQTYNTDMITPATNSLKQQTEQPITERKEQALPYFQVNKTSSSHGKDIGIAEQIGGVYIFNDCTPLGQYEVLGDVTFGGSSTSSVIAIPNGSGGTFLFSDEYTPQYTSIRNGLVANAVMANRAVEGIIVKISNEGGGESYYDKIFGRRRKG